jgi:hypothetical protein
MRKKQETPPPPPAPVQDEPVHRMELSRDELYRIVNACHHAHVELAKNLMFAIRNRGHAYSLVASRLDAAYIELIECGLDARFDVQFFLKKGKAESASFVGPNKDEE